MIRGITFILFIFIYSHANACVDELIDIEKIPSEGSEIILLKENETDAANQENQLPRRLINGYRYISKKILEESGVNAKAYIKISNYQNAEATYCGGEAVFSVTSPMLITIGSDTDALAAVISHEIVHLKNRHIEAAENNRKTTASLGKVVSAAGMILLAARGISNDDAYFGMKRIGENLGDAMYFSYNKDQETEADLQGIDIVVKSGFNPQGAIRLQQIFYSNSSKPSGDWRSHHPAWVERLSATRQYINQNYPNHAGMIDIKTVLPGVTPPTQIDDSIKPRADLGKISCQIGNEYVQFMTRIACMKLDGRIISKGKLSD